MVPSSRSLPRSTPEAQGLRSEAVGAFVEALDRRVAEVHSLILVHRGHVVAEGWWDPYGPDWKHMLFSLTKSFTSTAVGLAVAEGRLSIDDPVVSFFPGVAPARPSRYLATLTVRHLLTMSTGRLTDSMEDCARDPQRDWVRGFFRRPWLQAPGSPFAYDTGASHVLGAIVAKVTGEDLVAYLKPRLFDPLGIDGSDWETDFQGLRTGGFGLSLTTEDIAKFGQLLLQRGTWEGKSLVPAAWVDLATSKQVDNDRFSPHPHPDWRQGYGFQFWRSRHNGYRADGAFGQLCIVLPGQEAVLAVTGALDDTPALMDLVWTQLLPALGEKALPANPPAARALALRLGSLRLPPAAGELSSDLEAWVGARHFVVEANPLGIRDLRSTFEADKLVLTAVDARGRTHTLEAGRGRWLESPSTLFSGLAAAVRRDVAPVWPTVSSFTWTGPRTLTLVCRSIETPFVHTLVSTYEEGRLRVESRVNVGFGPRVLPRLVGVGRKV